MGLVLSIVMLSCTKEPTPSEEENNGYQHIHDLLSNKVILDWNFVAFEAAGGAAEGHALLASRSNAMMHIAMHDALNAIVPVFQQYAFRQRSNIWTDPIAASASAAHTVLKSLWPDSAKMLDERLARSLSAVANGAAKTKGIAVGIASGKAILAMRAGDGAFLDPIGVIPVSTVPGVYNAVPPTPFLFAPFWKTIQTFSLKRYDQFRSAPPPTLTSEVYTRSFIEVKSVGKLNSTTRTKDQSAYAKWWYEFSDIGWNRVARVKSANDSRKLYTTARMFALLNMAMADGYTAGWDSKFLYNFWRPYTAIRAAGTDRNEQTIPDESWEPAEPTPPVQDYPSTHCTLGNAAATVLTNFFGNNSGFSMTSTTAFPAGAIRSFENFIQAANENAESRVKAGIHFRFACEAGQKMGDQIGKWTLENQLKRLH